MLQFANVYKTYDQQTVLEISSLTLQRNIYWLQGINGSGKTTFLSMLAGLIPFKGDILLDGINLRQNPLSYRRLVNFAEAEPLYPEFITGFELVRFYQDIRKAASVQTDLLVNLFKMHRYLSMPIGTYSSGMIKKLSLLLAFIGKPSLILLDEPLATLDEGSILILPELIGAYNKEFKTCFIFSSHQPFKSYSLVINKIIINDQSLQFIT
ncbi:MAG TPA: ABC transporter ATP-binding protein [Puia sp.]|jgi:ABC-2 type transport system ATP-binding protein|nr:ABC transporter ATP-binding protein [Puia sp.]